MSKIIPKEQLDQYQAWSLPFVQEDGNRSAGHLTAGQLEQLQKQAYDEAYQLGLQEGKAKAFAQYKQQVENNIQQFTKLLDALNKPFTELDQQVEDELVSLCIALVKQMVRREIKIDPGQVVAVLREAVSSLPVIDRSIRLHLHPDDAALVRDVFSLSEDEKSWKIIEDPALSRGGCRVITENTEVDASLETRIAQLITKVFGGERQSDSKR